MKTKLLIVVLIVVLASVFAVACTPTRDACKLKYEQAGFTTKALSTHTLDIPSETVEFIYCGEKTSSQDYIEIVCFTNKDYASDYAELKKQNNSNESYVVEQKGKVVLYGTQNSIDIYNNKGGLTTTEQQEQTTEQE